MHSKDRESFERTLNIERRKLSSEDPEFEVSMQSTESARAPVHADSKLEGTDWVSLFDGLEKVRGEERRRVEERRAQEQQLAAQRRAQEQALLKLRDEIADFHDDLEGFSEYVQSLESNATDLKSWIYLAVESCDDIAVRAALEPESNGRCEVEFDDGRRMSIAAYKEWAIDFAARGAANAEADEIARGFVPVGQRTYDEGFAFGQAYARSLTVGHLLSLRDWLDEIMPPLNADNIWMAIHRDDGSSDDYWEEIHEFWNIDSDPWGRIWRLPNTYLTGFVDGLRGVVERVSRNVPE